MQVLRSKIRTNKKTNKEAFIWTDDEVQLLLTVTNEYKVAKSFQSKVIHHRFQKCPFSSVHTNTIRMRFRLYSLSTAFSNRCVFGEYAERIRTYWCGQKAKTHRNVCVFKRKQTSVDRAL